VASGALMAVPHPLSRQTNMRECPMSTPPVLLIVAALCAFAYAGVALISGRLLRHAPRFLSLSRSRPCGMVKVLSLGDRCPAGT
jgi:hypothetical protein